MNQRVFNEGFQLLSSFEVKCSGTEYMNEFKSSLRLHYIRYKKKKKMNHECFKCIPVTK